MRFEDLGLAEPIVQAVRADGYASPTPIQHQAIPHVLRGADLIGCAQTGTGKTAAFALPMLHRLSATASTPQANQRRRVRALVLCPTRELAAQIGDSFRAYGRNLSLRHAVIFGGVSQHHQVKALKAGVDTLIATPGRLLDLMQQGLVDLRAIEILVLDEADRMLDMGFIPDIRRIVKQLPQKRQTLLFSATMPDDIRQLASAILREPVTVHANVVASTVQTIRQSVYHVARDGKLALLTHLLKHTGTGRTLVFTRTKHGADRVVKQLSRVGIRAQAIHGNKSQNARTSALNSFRSASTPILVATDIASRGIDVDDIAHVINFDLPNVPETYVHRIGRTARAGASGVAISFCDQEERGDLRAIERLIRQPIHVERDQPAFENQPHEPASPRRDDGQRRREHDQRQPARGWASDRSRQPSRGKRAAAQPAAVVAPRAARPHAMAHPAHPAAQKVSAAGVRGRLQHKGRGRARSR